MSGGEIRKISYTIPVSREMLEDSLLLGSAVELTDEERAEIAHQQRRLATYKVQLADILDPNAETHAPGNRDAVLAIGSLHSADEHGCCKECVDLEYGGQEWPCRTAITLGRLQGLEPPAWWWSE